jgi:hypothetical protein
MSYKDRCVASRPPKKPRTRDAARAQTGHRPSKNGIIASMLLSDDDAVQLAARREKERDEDIGDLIEKDIIEEAERKLATTNRGDAGGGRSRGASGSSSSSSRPADTTTVLRGHMHSIAIGVAEHTHTVYTANPVEPWGMLSDGFEAFGWRCGRP